jgi:hypothetical protein
MQKDGQIIARLRTPKCIALVGPKLKATKAALGFNYVIYDFADKEQPGEIKLLWRTLRNWFDKNNTA